MKTLKSAVYLPNLSLIIISLFFLQSCSDDYVNNPPDTSGAYELKVWDYSENHFFLDTAYQASFVDFYNNTTISPQTNNLAVDEQSFEIWVQTGFDPQRVAALHIDLPVLPASGYDDSLKNPLSIHGVSAMGIVRKLQPSEYKLDKYPGFVSIKIYIPSNYFAGVAYKRTITGEQFGTISTDVNVNPGDTLVLKMIKVQNLVPADSLAWKMNLKNIYQLPNYNVAPEGFEFDVKYLSNGVYSPTLPINNLNAYLITILGLDKYTEGRTGPPNNKFDFLPGNTIDIENGWIIFPSLKPFLDGLESYNNNGVTIDPVYWYPQIYDDLKANAKTEANANNYIFNGHIPL